MITKVMSAAPLKLATATTTKLEQYGPSAVLGQHAARDAPPLNSTTAVCIANGMRNDFQKGSAAPLAVPSASHLSCLAEAADLTYGGLLSHFW
jgi:hypothetical protein